MTRILVNILRSIRLRFKKPKPGPFSFGYPVGGNQKSSTPPPKKEHEVLGEVTLFPPPQAKMLEQKEQPPSK